MGSMDPSIMVRLTTVGMLVGRAGPSPVGCLALPYMVAVSLLVGRARSSCSWLLSIQGSQGRCCPSGGKGQVLGWLAAQSWGFKD